ncbi:MAG: CRISPR-associated helicase Cas3' [Thermosphaera sp.]
MRRGVEALLKLIPDHDVIFFIAPTGYGKTLASPLILKEFIESGRSAGLIHVAPLKTLVRKIFEEKFAGTGFNTGYQSQDSFEEKDKTPFFMRELVVTTLDSFMMNLYKIPVAEMGKVLLEKSAGHYYVPLSFILTSTVVFDEAHVYTGGVDESISLDIVYAGISFLTYLKIPFIVETATMNTKVIGNLASIISKSRGGAGSRIPVVYVSCGGSNPQIQKLSESNSLDVENIVDEDYCRSNNIEWKTSFKTESDALEIAVERAGSGKPVLVVRNTVEKAFNTYKYLKGKTSSKIALIHGRMSIRDRESALKKVDDIMDNGGIVVATQVIEAGVESNASTLITDPAPIENLVQRAGRLCREGSKVYEDCLKEGGEVILIDPGSLNAGKDERYDVYMIQRVKDTVEELKKALNNGFLINWRLPDTIDKVIGFTEIIEKVSPPTSKTSDNSPNSGGKLLEQYLMCEGSFEVFKSLANALGLEGFLRDSAQLNMLIPRTTMPQIPQVDKGPVIVEIQDVDFISIDAEWFLRKEVREFSKGRACLEYRGDKALIAKQADSTGTRFKISLSKKLGKNLLQKDSQQYKSLKLWEIPSIYMDDSNEEYQYLILNPRCYSPGEGLLVV